MVNGKSFGYALAVSALTCVSGLAQASELQQYVIRGNRAAIRAEVASQGRALHDLVYFNGVVVELPSHAVERIQARLGSGFSIELDQEAQVAGKVISGAPAPSPTPTPAPAAQIVPWGINKIKAREANSIVNGAGVLVCVVDTGIQANHPDLGGRVVGGRNFYGKGQIDPNRWADDHGHGTHVAGSIAAQDNSVGVVGVAPGAQLYAVKALGGSNATGSTSAIADGVLECVARGTHVINLSLMIGAYSQVLHDAVRTATAAGITVVAAAGNSATAVAYPAAYPEVLAISAIDEFNRLFVNSNSGPEIDFTAPGVQVYSSTINSGYQYRSGTSMATAHVSGVAALKISAGMSQILADDIGLPLNHQGAGLVNAYRTVQGF